MEVLVKREDSVTLRVQRQAAVEAFNETFVFAGLIITIGIVPALGIRKVSYPVLIK